MSDASHSPMTQIADYIGELIHKHFRDQIESIYLGDVGIYPPQAFTDRLGNERLAVSLQYRYNRGTSNRSHAGEERKLGLNLVVMVNMVPYFEALPQQAYGERRLIETVERLAQFFSLSENSDLHGRISHLTVGDIDVTWTQRNDMSIRAAIIPLEMSVYMDNLA